MKKATATSNAESATPAVAIRILKIGTCPSLSGKSTLTYHIGCTTESDIQLRVFGNTGGGFFNNDWVPLAGIQKLLANVPSGKTITSFALAPTYSGKSTNSAAFLFSALMKEGLVQPAKDKKRCYELTTDAAAKFFADVKALIASDVDLKIAEKAPKAGAKKVAKAIAKTPKAESTPAPVAAIPPKEEPKVGQQFEPISKQPWPIKEKASKAATKKA